MNLFIKDRRFVKTGKNRRVSFCACTYGLPTIHLSDAKKAMLPFLFALTCLAAVTGQSTQTLVISNLVKENAISAVRIRQPVSGSPIRPF